MGRGVEPLKKKVGRAKTGLCQCRSVGWDWREWGEGERVRLLSKRYSWLLLLLLHTYVLCYVGKRVSAIHVLLAALTPTSEVSENLSTDLGKTGGGPYSHAVIREMFSPCLDPACKPCAGRAKGKANAQGGP